MNQLRKKLALDVLLFALWAVLMVYSLTGGFLHELFGLAMLFFIALHLYLNRKWIASVSRRLFTTSSSKASWSFVLNAVIGILMLLTCISGIFISKDLLPALSSSNFALWSILHGWFAYLDMALIAVHIGLHGKLIGSALGLNRLVKPVKAVYNLFAAAVILYGILASLRYPYPVYEAPAEANAEPSGTTSKTASNKAFITVTSSDFPQPGETLDDFLGRLICTACGKRCPLSAPRCGRGETQATKAEQVYEQYQDQSDGSSVGIDDSTEQKIADDTDISSADIAPYEANFVDVFTIMGMYTGGTYYVGRFATKKRRQD